MEDVLLCLRNKYAKREHVSKGKLFTFSFFTKQTIFLCGNPKPNGVREQIACEEDNLLRKCFTDSSTSRGR